MSEEDISHTFTADQDFSCKYLNHPCQLREIQRQTLQTKNDRLWFFVKRCFLISEHNFASYWHFRSKGAIEMEFMRQLKNNHWYIVHPYSLLRLFWVFFTSIVFLADMVFIPFNCSFLNSFMAKYYYKKGRPLVNIYGGAIAELIFSLIWWLDALGNFITGYYDKKEAKFVTNPREIFRNYLLPWFFVDFSSSLPLDYIIIYFYGMDTYANLGLPSFFLLQVYSMYSLIRFRYFFGGWSRLANVHRSWKRGFWLLSALLIFYFILSWSICLNIFIPELTMGDSLYEMNNTFRSWIQTSNLLQSTLAQQYTLSIQNSLHSTLGMTAPWLNLFSIEDFLLAIIIMITCEVYWLYFLIITLEMITASNAIQINLHLIRNQFNAYLKQQDLTSSQKKRLNRFYLYRFQSEYLGNKTILKTLPKFLKKEICQNTCIKLVQNSELFQSIPRKIMLRLPRLMNREIFFPHDVIVEGNATGTCMYFITSGVVVVSTLSGKEICTLKDGDFFGEIAMIAQEKRRTATVTALTMVETYRLGFPEYKKVIQLYPDFKNRIEKYAVDRFRTIVGLEERPDSSQ